MKQKKTFNEVKGRSNKSVFQIQKQENDDDDDIILNSDCLNRGMCDIILKN